MDLIIVQVRSNEDAEPHLYEQVQCGPWEITKANLVFTSDKLGQGQFGQVRKAFIKNIRSHDVAVALKSLKGRCPLALILSLAI